MFLQRLNDPHRLWNHLMSTTAIEPFSDDQPLIESTERCRSRAHILSVKHDTQRNRKHLDDRKVP